MLGNTMKNILIVEGIIHTDISMRKTKKNNKLSIHFILVNQVGNWKNYINCKAFGKQAEIVCKEFQKGVAVKIEGEIKTDFYKETLRLNKSKFTYINIKEIVSL